MNDCADWLDQFAATFPEFFKCDKLDLPSISLLAQSNMNGSIGYYSYYASTLSSVGICLNGNYHSNLALFQSYVENCVNSKWYPANATAHKTFVHEFGHYVSNTLAKVYGRDFEHKFIEDCVVAFKKEVPDYTYNTYVGLSDYLSRYGSTKECECFAEAFAEYFGGENPRTFAKIFGEMLEKKLKGV